MTGETIYVDDAAAPEDCLRDRSRWWRLRIRAGNARGTCEFDLPWPPGAPLFVAKRFEWLHEHGWRFTAGGDHA